MIIFQHPYHPDLNITVYDLLVVPILLSFIYMFAWRRKEKKIKEELYYRYYPLAITIKAIVSVVFAIVVFFFYPGDSMGYFRNINSLINLFYLDSTKYFDILLNGNLPEYWSYFTTETGYPAYYMWRDPNAMFVARVFSPFFLLTYKSYIISSIIAGLIGFSGIWKIFQFFCKIYPKLDRYLALGILYFPSVLFWSSGIMKDTLTLSAVGWVVYSFYMLFGERKIKLKYIIALFLGAVLIVNVKAYIFMALIPGLLVWLFFDQIKRIKSGFMKFVLAPLLIAALVVGFTLLTGSLSTSLGTYGNIESSAQKAQVIQQDLTRGEQYGENYYDIGEFDPTPAGLISKAPIAIVSGIFRPFVWEATNPFILLAGLESLFMMFMLINVVFRRKFIKNLFLDPVMIFSMCFVLLFGFGIGLASANFGALVRYKIPLLPFFASSLAVLYFRAKNESNNINNSNHRLKKQD